MAFIDARTLPNATEVSADLLIIGGGMAGIAIAKQWANTGKSVAILESGGQELSDDIQALYAGTGVMRAPGNADRNIDSYLIQSRFRGLGGSGNVWGGKCAPLDPADFAERDWLERTGWPVTRAEMQPYYDRACNLLEIPLYNREFDAAPLADRPPLAIGDGFFAAPRYFSPVSGYADRERFDHFRTEFAEAPNISIYLHANVTQIRLRSNGRQVEALDVACLNGNRHTARARNYILAAGGIENVRILLASRSVHAPGVGNHSDLVGRCFQGHVTFGVYEHPDGLNTGLAITNGQSTTLYTNNGRDVVHCVIGAAHAGQRRHNSGNFTTTLVRSDAQLTAEDNAVVALANHLDSNGAPGGWTPCFFMSEHLPNPESRLTLHEGHTDALGMPYVHLDWVYSERDLDILDRSIAALGDALGAASSGRVRWPVERSALLSILNTSRHHMGTTRMSEDPDHGVVDENSRVHGVRNLYVAGSSVFPTSGIANPTLTLIAMSMRLSDHLKRQMGVRA